MSTRHCMPFNAYICVYIIFCMCYVRSFFFLSSYFASLSFEIRLKMKWKVLYARQDIKNFFLALSLSLSTFFLFKFKSSTNISFPYDREYIVAWADKWCIHFERFGMLAEIDYIDFNVKWDAHSCVDINPLDANYKWLGKMYGKYRI